MAGVRRASVHTASYCNSQSRTSLLQRGAHCWQGAGGSRGKKKWRWGGKEGREEGRKGGEGGGGKKRAGRKGKEGREEGGRREQVGKEVEGRREGGKEGGEKRRGGKDRRWEKKKGVPISTALLTIASSQNICFYQLVVVFNHAYANIHVLN